MRRPQTILTALATCLFAVAAQAASTTGGIRGVVKDPGGKAVDGADVRLMLIGFNTTNELTTDEKGKFIQMGIKAGRYELTVSKSGYETLRQEVAIKLGGRTPVEVTLVPQGATSGGGDGSASFSLGGIELSAEAAAAYEKAKGALAAGDSAAARTHLEQLIELAPEVATPYLILAQLEREAGATDAATEHLSRGLELDPARADGWIVLGELRTDAGDYDGAVEAFRKATEVAPDSAPAHGKLGMGLVMKQDFAGAVAALDRYLELAPNAPDAGQKRTLVNELRKMNP